MNIEQILGRMTCQLTDAGIESPRLDAEILLSHLLKKDRSYLFAWSDKVLSAKQINQFSQWIQRRATHEPVAYILGKRDFWSFSLKLNKYTLIPRPETELLVEIALEKIAELSVDKVLDLGTGSGAIAAAIKSDAPSCQVIATDACADALAQARLNFSELGLDIRCVHGRWFQPLARCQKFDLILSNPPYIRQDDPHLKQGDLPCEPLTALAAGLDGLNDIRHIISHAPDYLSDGGYLLLEHGYDQAEAIKRLLLDRGFSNIDCRQDIAQLDRVSLACWLG